MQILSGWCSVGSADVPKDAAKASYWREMGLSSNDGVQEKKDP